MIKPDDKIWDDIAQEMNDAKIAKTVANQWANTLGCTIQSIYRNAKLHGYNSGKETRSDKGTSSISEQTLTIAADINANAIRKNGKSLGTAENTIRLLEDNGYIEKGTLAPANLNLLLRQRGLSKKQLQAPDPTQTTRSKYPNHVHCLDATVWFQYYDQKNGKIGHRVVSTAFYKNKIHTIKAMLKVPHFHLFTLTDHFSGATWGRVYYSAGESADNMIDFLYHAWKPKDDPARAPFCGVPEILLTDNGPAIKSNIMKRFLENFKVKHLTHKPYQPWGKGQVEQAHNNIEIGFGANTVEQPPTDAQQMNHWLEKWLIDFNARCIHRRHGHARFPFWAAHARDHIKLPPADIETFKHCALSAPETRKVQKDRVVHFEAKQYHINHSHFLVGDKLKVNYSPFEYPAIIIENTTRTTDILTLKPVITNVAGFPIDAPVFGESFKQPRHTITMKRRKELAAEREKIDQKGGLQAHNYPESPVIHMQPHRNAEEIEPLEIVTPLITKTDAIDHIVKELGNIPLDDATIEFIDAKWDGMETLTQKQIDQTINQIENGQTTIALEA